MHSKTPLAIILKEELKQAGLDIGKPSRILAKKRGRRWKAKKEQISWKES